MVCKIGRCVSGAFFVASMVVAIPSAAKEITWSGQGNTLAWSDGANWDGGVAPAKGDIAVLPAGATVGMTQADVNYVIAASTKLGGIHFAGDDTVLLVTNLTAQKDFDIPFTGGGECRMLNSANPNYIKMLADNSSYHGSFVISNAAAYLGSRLGMGVTNSITYWGNSISGQKYFTTGPGVTCSNELYTYGSTYLINGGNGPTFYGPIHIRGVTQFLTSGTMAMRYYGGMTYEGSLTGNAILFVGQQIFGGKPIDFGGLWMAGNGSGAYNDGGTWTFDTDVSSAMVVPPSYAGSPGAGLVRFLRPNCFTPKTGLRLGRATGDATGVDLNGFDQRCCDLVIAKNGAMNPTYTYITSASEATFTILGSGPTQFNGLINGKASLELNSTNSATAGSIGLCGTANATTGALIARRGMINIAPAAVFSNLTALVVSGDGVINAQMTATLAGLNTIDVSGNGTLNLNSAAVNENLAALEISDSGSVVLSGGAKCKFYSVKIGDKYLAVDDYDIGDEALGGAITGEGSISVFAKPVTPGGDHVWSGATSSDMHLASNWDGADIPDFAEGNATAIFDDSGTATAEMTAAGSLDGIVFRRGTAFALGGTSAVGLGAGGIVATNTAASGTVTNTLLTTVHLGFLPQRDWTLGERTVLDVRAPLTSIDLPGADPVGIGGDGTLILRASSPNLTVPLVITNAMTRILHPQALGSTNRTVSLKAGMIRFAGAGLTNDVPLRICGGANNYQTDSMTTTPWVQRGKMTAAAVFTQMYCGNGYRFQGGLETEPGCVWYFTLASGYNLYIENKPIHCSEKITMGNSGTYHLSSTNNVHATIQINEGTLSLENDYVLCESGTLQLGNGNAAQCGNVCLNTYAQRLGRLTCGWTPSANPTFAGRVYGASGVLEVVGSMGSNLAVNFQGGTSYRHSGAGTNVFWNIASTSTGRLEVLNGKVTFRDGAGWSKVTKVSISGTGVIGVEASSADVAFGPEAGKSRATLEFPADTGTLEISSGTATVRRLKIGGLYWHPGTYSASDLPGRISGGGSLRVLSDGGVMLIVK